MNWANRLTISRLILTVVFVAMLNCAWPYARTAAFIIFLIAGVTDFVDGEIARRYGIVTNFGKLMDPLVDKIMMAAAFISLVPMGARSPASTTKRIAPWRNVKCESWRKPRRRSLKCAKFFSGIGLDSSRRANPPWWCG